MMLALAMEAVTTVLMRGHTTHRLADDVTGIDFSFDCGVKVWSDQTSLMTSLEYLF